MRRSQAIGPTPTATGWRVRANLWREATRPARWLGGQRSADGSGDATPLALLPRWRGQRCALSAAGLSAAVWRREFKRKLNMSARDFNLYFFLCLLAGFAAFLAIECIQKFCRPKPPVVLPRPSTVSEQAVEPPSPPTHPPSPFGRLCESVKDLPAKEQASRVREYFGIVGGARPVERRDRPGKRQ